MYLMIGPAIHRLNYLVENIPTLLTTIHEEKMSEKHSLNKWSKKEIVGHLIDSATNNHQRFVRGQFESIPEIHYDENKWNQYSYYQQMDSIQIVSFWTIYNKQLIEVITRIPLENLKRQINVGNRLLTLEYLINDYVEHLEHHLKQVIDY